MNETKKAIALETVTRIIGEPTKQDVEKLEEELAEIAVKFQTGTFTGGDEFGHMCLVVSQEKYRTIINDNAWTYTEPVKPQAFDETLTNAATDLAQKKRIAQHTRKIEEYELFKGVLVGLRERILYAVDEQYLRPLKATLLGYARVTPRQMIQHLLDNCVVGTLDLDRMKEDLNEPWQGEDHINEYIRKLNDRREKLQDAGVNVSENQMTIKFVKQMYRCGHFDELDLTAWEKKTAANKTYANAQAYFTEKYKEKMSFRKATARQMGYANQATEMNETLKETLTQIADAAQQDHQYVNSMAETQKKMMETMMTTLMENQKAMTALMEKLAKGKSTEQGNKSQLTEEEKCPLCKRRKHKGGVSECWEDPANVDKQPQWYKDRKAKKAAKKASS